MSVESALYSYLTGVTGVTDVIGTRLYSDLANASGITRPFVSYFVVSENPSRHFGGPAGLKFARIQMDVWASSGPSRRAVAEALRLALDGFSGTMGAELLVVRRCALDMVRNTYVDPEDGTETPTYRATIEVEITHQESVPTFA